MVRNRNPSVQLPAPQGRYVRARVATTRTTWPALFQPRPTVKRVTTRAWASITAQRVPQEQELPTGMVALAVS